jgi:hypothetical protein
LRSHSSLKPSECNAEVLAVRFHVHRPDRILWGRAHLPGLLPRRRRDWSALGGASRCSRHAEPLPQSRRLEPSRRLRLSRVSRRRHASKQKAGRALRATLNRSSRPAHQHHRGDRSAGTTQPIASRRSGRDPSLTKASTSFCKTGPSNGRRHWCGVLG